MLFRSWLGTAIGRRIHALAHNRDPRPVQRRARRKSIGAQRALGRARRDPGSVDTVVVELVDRVTRRLRDGNRTGRTITIRLRFGDYTSVTRSHTIERTTAHTQTILDEARGLMAAAQPLIRDRGLTLVGISVGNLDDGEGEPSLDFDERPKAALDAALDTVRHRFGADAITRAVQIGREQGVSVPVLPD